jgi:dUTP pyrophosphatase
LIRKNHIEKWPYIHPELNIRVTDIGNYGWKGRNNLMIKIKTLFEDVKPPQKSVYGDAGFDVFSRETKVLKPFERYRFKLGFCVEFPEGHVLMVNEKSGMALNNGLISIANVIDSQYRGEISAILVNLSELETEIKKDQKIAQILLMNCYTGTEIKIVEKLTETDRGEKGFGSTGNF